MFPKVAKIFTIGIAQFNFLRKVYYRKKHPHDFESQILSTGRRLKKKKKQSHANSISAILLNQVKDTDSHKGPLPISICVTFNCAIPAYNTFYIHWDKTATTTTLILQVL